MTYPGRFLCRPAATRVGEPDAGNLHVRFDEGEQANTCSLLDRINMVDRRDGSQPAGW
jgi:hypothetical protein